MRKTKLKVKKVLKGRKKKPSVTTLRSKADKVFSLSIRYRDGEQRSDGWYAPCITCGKWLPLPKIHAGHFMSRRYGATRYDEENVNAQCAGCNTFNHGEQYKYGLEVDLKYGTGTAKKLHKLAHSKFRLTTEFLEQVIKDASEQVSFYLRP